MSKLGAVIIVIVMVAACYLLMLVVIPVANDLIVTANTTMTASVDNLTAYPGAQDFLISIPWILWFVPATIGAIIIVLLLRSA